MAPLVTIIVPCHNAAPWVAETLRSALSQTHRPIEIIVIDDGSTDNSLEIVRPFEKQGVRVVTQPNAGASSARNRGVQLARGEFLEFLDADDLITPDKIAAQVALLTRPENAGAVASCKWGRFVDDPERAIFADPEVCRDLAPIDFLLLHAREAKMMHPAAWLVPSAIVAKAGPWDPALSLNDDGEFFARVLLQASKIVHADAGASLYRSGLPDSLSRRRDRRAMESLFRSVLLVSKHIQQREDSARVRAALADYWQRAVYELYPDAHDLSARAATEAQRLGGSSVEPAMGHRQRALARLLGWRLTRRLIRLFGR